MAGYSKVPRQLFADPDFRALPEDSRHLYLYLLVCPHANSFGYFIVSDGYVRDDLQWEPERLAAAWGPLLQSQLVQRDARTRTVLILRALAENAPENPSVVKGWRSILEGLPRSPLLATLSKEARLYLKQPWQLEWLPPEIPAATGDREEGQSGQPKPGDIPSTGREQGKIDGVGLLPDTLPAASGQGGGHDVDTVSRPCQQGVAHCVDIPSPSPNPSPNPNPNPNAAAARAPAQGSVSQVITESKTRPTLPTGTEQGETDTVGRVGDTMPIPSSHGVPHCADTVSRPCRQDVAHRADTVSRPCPKDVAHVANIVDATPKAAAAEEGRSPPGTACRCYENIWGFLAGGQHDRDVFIDLEARYPADWLEAAFRECADSGQTCRNFKYLQRILARWEIEGFKSPRKENRNGGVQTIGRGAHRKDRQPIRPIEFQEDGPD